MKKISMFARIMEHFEWLEYKSNHKELVCGIDGSECSWYACWDKKAFKHHGCMYLKGYKNY